MPQQLKDLKEFYKEHYSKLLDGNKILYYDKMSYILAYEAIDIETNIKNIIIKYFLNHLNKYVNIEFKLKENMDNITKENKDKEIRLQKKKEFYSEIKKNI
jgi:hypothetical protein